LTVRPANVAAGADPTFTVTVPATGVAGNVTVIPAAVIALGVTVDSSPVATTVDLCSVPHPAAMSATTTIIPFHRNDPTRPTLVIIASRRADGAAVTAGNLAGR
jgi:hypothetical protein